MFADIVKSAQKGLLVQAVFGEVSTLTLRDHGPATRQAVLELVRHLSRGHRSGAAAQRAGGGVCAGALGAVA